MSTEAQAQHPQVAQALEQLEKFNQILEDQMHLTNTGSFTATDQAKTVTVTINGNHLLTGMFIEEGLLRLGAETVEQRINEALVHAQAQATAAINGQQHQLITALVDITDDLAKSIGL